MKEGMRLPPFSSMAVLHAATSGQAHRGRRVTRGSSYPRRCALCSVHCVVWKKGRPLTASLLSQVEGLIAEARRLFAIVTINRARGRRLFNLDTSPRVHAFEGKKGVLRAEATPRLQLPFARRASTSFALKIGSCK